MYFYYSTCPDQTDGLQNINSLDSGGTCIKEKLRLRPLETMVRQTSTLFQAFFPIIRLPFHMHDRVSNHQFIPIDLINDRIRKTPENNSFRPMKVGRAGLRKIHQVLNSPIKFLYKI